MADITDTLVTDDIYSRATISDQFQVPDFVFNSNPISGLASTSGQVADQFATVSINCQVMQSSSATNLISSGAKADKELIMNSEKEPHVPKIPIVSDRATVLNFDT